MILSTDTFQIPKPWYYWMVVGGFLRVLSRCNEGGDSCLVVVSWRELNQWTQSYSLYIQYPKGCCTKLSSLLPSFPSWNTYKSLSLTRSTRRVLGDIPEVAPGHITSADRIHALYLLRRQRVEDVSRGTCLKLIRKERESVSGDIYNSCWSIQAN